MITSGSYWMAFLLSVVIHELGHLVAAALFGLRVKRIGFSRRGPYIVREMGSPFQNAIVSAAGPLFNLVFAAVAIHSWQWFAFFNIVLGMSNLVPTKNSDGGRILKAIRMLKTAEPDLTTADPARIGAE